MSRAMSTPRFVLPILLAGMVLGACSTAAPPVQYYSLVAPHPTRQAGQATSQLAISIGPVTAPDILHRSQIAIGGAEGRYRLSDFHRWAGDVDRDFALALAEDVGGRLGTERVFLYAGQQSQAPDLQVTLDILEMGGEPGGQANLTVRWSLVDSKSGQVILTRRSACDQPTPGPGFEGWVSAQRQCLGRLGEEVATAIGSPGIRPHR